MVKSKARGSPARQNFLTNSEHLSHYGMQDFNRNSGVWLAGVNFPHPSYVFLSLAVILDKRIPQTRVICKLPPSLLAWKTRAKAQRVDSKRLILTRPKLRGCCWTEQSCGVMALSP